MKILSFLVLISLFHQNIWGQSFPKGHYFEASTHIGRIFKHRSFIPIAFNDIRSTLGVELNWEQQTFGQRYWHSSSKFPQLGLALSFQDFGDSRLGWGLGIMPNIKVTFLRYRRMEFFGRLAMGFAYVSTFWHPFDNPDNIILGSHLNNNTGFRLGLSFDVSKQWELRPSFSFTHYSNAASQFPNLGINVMSFHMGVLFKANPVLELDYQKPNEPIQRIRRLQYHLSFALGMKEIGRTYRGPKYPISITTFDMGLFLNPNNRLKLGFAHEYHIAERVFFQHASGYVLPVAKNLGHRYLFFVEDEFLLGHFGLTAQLGYYLSEAPSDLPFTRIGLRYYPLDPLKYRSTPYIGLRMKSHLITAEFFDLVIGVTFN